MFKEILKYFAKHDGSVNKFLSVTPSDGYPLWGKAVKPPGGKRYQYKILRIPFMRYINGKWDASEV